MDPVGEVGIIGRSPVPLEREHPTAWAYRAKWQDRDALLRDRVNDLLFGLFAVREEATAQKNDA